MRYLLILLAILIYNPVARADDTNTQTNTSGSNTNITGGYESTSETTYADGSTNTTTTNNDTTATTNNKSTVPPPSARTKIIEKIDAEISAQQLKEEEERLAEEVRLKELKALKEKENEIIVEIIIPPVNNYADIDRE
jgi:hypothetical protein